MWCEERQKVGAPGLAGGSGAISISHGPIGEFDVRGAIW